MTKSILSLYAAGKILTVPAPGDLVLIGDISEALPANQTKVIATSDLINLATLSAAQALVGSQAAGDVFYAASPTAIARLAKPASTTSILQNTSGGTLSWLTIAALAALVAPTTPLVKRVLSEATNSAPAINVDNYDVYSIYALASAATIGAPTGTKTDLRPLVYRIRDDGTARALTWNAAFRGVGCTLPAATKASASIELYVGFMWNANANTWDCPNAIA